MDSYNCPSPSALRVATARAAHQLLEDDLIFEDPFAIAALGSANAAALMRAPYTHNDISSRSLRAGIIARTRLSEDRTLKAITEGTEQYAIIGAGLDTWALRTALTLPAVAVFELDQPKMQTWKSNIYTQNRWAKPENLHYVSADLCEMPSVDRLSSAGADLSKSINISILGVLVYFDDSIVRREIASLQQLPSGSTVTLDYRVDERWLNPVETVMMQFTANMMAAGGEPWRSASSPQDICEMLSKSGFDVEEDLGTPELNQRYFSPRKDGLQIAGGGFRYLTAVKR